MERAASFAYASILLLLTGCATFRGAPPAPFVVKDVWEKDSIQAAVKSLTGTCPTPANGCAVVIDNVGRNKNAHLLLALVDTEYRDFVQKLVYEKQHVQASTNFLRLLMTTAGGLTSSIGVKDNYLAGASLLTGGDAIFDNEYLFKETARALAAQMDASRAKMRTAINLKLGLPYPDYPGPSVLADVQAYYRAGTIAQAVTDTQREAAVKQSVEENEQMNAVVNRLKVLKNVNEAGRSAETIR